MFGKESDNLYIDVSVKEKRAFAKKREEMNLRKKSKKHFMTKKDVLQKIEKWRKSFSMATKTSHL